jgi:hypothetical protein
VADDDGAGEAAPPGSDAAAVHKRDKRKAKAARQARKRNRR